MTILLVGIWFFLSGCGSSPSRRFEDEKPRSVSLGDAEEETSINTEKNNPAPRKVKPPAFQSMKEFMSYYRKTLEALGQKKENGSYQVDSEDIEGMKQQMARLLQVDLSGLTFLINPRTQSAWFGNCALMLDKKQEKFIILSGAGEEQMLSLRDKVFGGLYKSETGEWVFISAFYGDLQKKVPYRVFWGASEVKVVSFSIDRTKEGTVEGQIKSPTGKMLNIFRKGRDNRSVQINGQVLSPVFE